MNTISSGYNDNIVYTNTILLAAKCSFQHHVQKLDQSIILLQKKRRHVPSKQEC